MNSAKKQKKTQNGKDQRSLQENAAIKETFQVCQVKGQKQSGPNRSKRDYEELQEYIEEVY